MRQMACLLILGCASAGAQQPATFCSDIQDPQQRLACFDRQYPTRSEPNPGETAPTPAKAAESTPSEPDPVPSVAPTTTPIIEERPISSQQATQPARSTATPSAELMPPKQGGIFSRDPELDLTQTVAGVRYQDGQRMVFRLANDEVWMQLSPRMLRIRKGDSVTIKNGRFGGYMLTSEGGTKTRVKRIK